MFIDEARIEVQGGRGGNGATSFRHEKYVPRGGPDGGDGGRGGSVILRTDPGLTTLIDFRSQRHYKAVSARHGEGTNKGGRDGADLVLKVPVGTLVIDDATGETLADLSAPGEAFVAARGGTGGKGNSHFATSIRQIPRFSELGEPGQTRTLRLELKLLADVGIIGFPNVGKSTLIARCSAARPKIADYPFTTLIPNLGVVRVDDDRSFVMADIPGLVEGAHQGAGLGLQFLKHIERTRVLVHVLDCSGASSRDPLEDYRIVNRELVAYSPRLATLPQLVALNKADVPGSEEPIERIRAALDGEATDLFDLSAVTGLGVPDLIYRLATIVDAAKPSVGEVTLSIPVILGQELERRWRVQRDEGTLVVYGDEIARIVQMTDLDNDEAVQRLHRRLEGHGVLRALRRAGVKEGDTVRIAGLEFDYVE